MTGRMWIVGLLLFGLGCSGQMSPVTGDAEAVITEPKADAGIQPPQYDPQLRLITVADFERELEKHRGRVVLLDMWATW